MDQRELLGERIYAAQVQQLLLALIDQSQEISDDHAQSIRMILEDAWFELRLRPTNLSPEEQEQLAIEVDRYRVRREFSDDMAARARRMLMEPFFARVDFAESGTDGVERIVIGLYSLPDEKGNLKVYDWRAPICSLYYDAEPGEVSYLSPSGVISGKMTLKRQYKMEKGHLLYYVDTSLSIDDALLLDILSGSSSRHMRQIVSTIQSEQNAAIRCDHAKVVSVVGSAGSGKTSVALHRAAFLMYRRRDLLDASKIQILSPSTAFSEYISTVLPELGEENIRARTLQEMVEEILGRKVESPMRQLSRLTEEDVALRTLSVSYKGTPTFMRQLRRLADRFAEKGPQFRDVTLDERVILSASDLSRMYQNEFTRLTPAQRMERMRAALSARMSGWEANLYKQYEPHFAANYSGKELAFVTKMAVSQRLQSIRRQLEDMMNVRAAAMLEPILQDAPKALRDAYRENRAAGITWWEDALAEAYLAVRLGFAHPDKSVYHLLIDEAQDYSETALALLHAYHPNASATLLGDPMQRTCPGMPACDPAEWGECFDAVDAPVFHLSRCYRSTLPIARFCAALLPGQDAVTPIGREGEMPIAASYSREKLQETLACYRGTGYKSVAVITRTQGQADSFSAILDHVYRLDGGEADLNYESDDNVVACYHLTKGLEFDAAIVVWPDCELNEGERRRLYTACSRALHALALLTSDRMLEQLKLDPWTKVTL